MSKCANLEAHSETAKTQMSYFPPLQTINGDSEFISNDVTELV